MWDLKKLRDEAIGITVGIAATVASLPIAATTMAVRVLDGDTIDQASNEAGKVIEDIGNGGYEFAKENADTIVGLISLGMAVDGLAHRHPGTPTKGGNS